MTIVYGNQIELGGMELDDYEYQGNCPFCGYDEAVHRSYEKAEGAINRYYAVSCPKCGHREDSGSQYDIDSGSKLKV